MKTVVVTFADVPEANVIRTDTELQRYDEVDISIAGATENGPVTPVIRAVNKMNLNQISTATEDFIARARICRLKRKPVFVAGSIKVAALINFTLSVDHRAIGGSVATQWL